MFPAGSVRAAPSRTSQTASQKRGSCFNP